MKADITKDYIYLIWDTHSLKFVISYRTNSYNSKKAMFGTFGTAQICCDGLNEEVGMSDRYMVHEYCRGEA